MHTHLELVHPSGELTNVNFLKCPSLFQMVVLVWTFTVSDSSITTTAFLCSIFTWKVCLWSFTIECL